MENDYRDTLRNELERRSTTRPAYSLRAFARDLGIAAPQLSAILAGAKGLSKQKADRMARTLNFSADEKKFFVASVVATHARSQAERQSAQKTLQKITKLASSKFRVVREAEFQIIADWYHVAILHLSETEGFEWDTRLVAKRLGITESEAQKAFVALQTAGVLSDENGRLVRAQPFIQTENVPSRAIRFNHLQMINKATQALEEQAFEERDFSSVTVALNPKKVPELKAWLADFREKFCLEAEKGPGKSEVYSLNLQFFKISKPGDFK